MHYFSLTGLLEMLFGTLVYLYRLLLNQTNFFLMRRALKWKKQLQQPSTVSLQLQQVPFFLLQYLQEQQLVVRFFQQ